MPIPIKIIIGASSHYHQLKSGPIKYQKSRPTSPVWRILLIDDDNNRMHLRFFSSQPSAEEIDKIVMGILSSEDLLSKDIVVPKTVEKLCPGLQEKLMANGVGVYLPAHGFASGSLAVKEADKFLASLAIYLSGVRESMASCEEIAATVGNPSGFVSMGLWLENNKDTKYLSSYKMAEDITRLRGRDPELGRQMRKNEFFWGPVNKGKYVPPAEDVLKSLINRRTPLMAEPGLRDVVYQLQRIREAEPDHKLTLIRKLGALVVFHHISATKRNQYYYISDLSYFLPDRSLFYLVMMGVKEALKNLIIIDSSLLQILSAKITVCYPRDCTDLSLRGIPAHHRLETMVQQITGGKIAISPELNTFSPRDSNFPAEFHDIWIPFHSCQVSSRTPLNPRQCLVPISKAGGSQKKEGFIFVLAILPKETKTYVPVGDSDLADRMTSLVNERLARNGKGVTCQIWPMQMYGNLMEIGDPPEK